MEICQAIGLDILLLCMTIQCIYSEAGMGMKRSMIFISTHSHPTIGSGLGGFVEISLQVDIGMLRSC